jgi:hypothetical protein
MAMLIHQTMAGDYKKALADITDAVKAGNEDIIAATVEEMVNLLPEKYTFYGMGVSYGQRNELVFVKTSKMYGTVYQMPINPRRMLDTECLYVADTYAGYVAFITEEAVTIPTCKHSPWMNTLTNIPFKKVIARDNLIKTSGIMQETGQPLTSLIDVDTDTKEVKSFHLGDIGQNYVQGDNMVVLAGRVVEVLYGTLKVKQFVPSVEITLTPTTLVFSVKHEPTARLIAAIKASLAKHTFEYPPKNQ